MKKFILIIVLALSANLFLNNFAIGQNNEPIGCNGQYYVSHGNSGNANGNTLLKKLSFSGSTISATAFGLNPSTYGFNAIGLNPIDGYIYAIRYPNGSNEPHLVKIGNGGTNVHDLGEIDGGSGGVSNEDICYAACFDSNGDFYFVDNTREELRKITNANLNGSRSSSLVGSNSAYGTIYDIAINPVTGQMYGTNSSTNSNYLVAINKSNGNLSTAVGPNMGGAGYFAGLFFDEVGELYGYRADGGFYQINKSTGALTAAGSGASYTYADGCSCTFGRVYHDLDFTANPSNQICPSAQTPNPSFPLDVIVHNKSNAQQTGLTYTLDISDPAKRFRFTQSAATIKANIVAAGLGTNGGTTVTLSTVAPATGTNYNKVVVTGFQTGPVNSDKTFTLQVQLYTTGGTYNPIPLQSEITGLPVVLGSSDLSNDPTSIPPDDATVISF
ncbi:MAG: hypothetical protein KDC06_11155, partial [Chitinophagaceae bacterium]|nr:hypothetical protein [Chitinophagaceae bacterium]